MSNIEDILKITDDNTMSEITYKIGEKVKIKDEWLRSQFASHAVIKNIVSLEDNQLVFYLEFCQPKQPGNAWLNGNMICHALRVV